MLIRPTESLLLHEENKVFQKAAKEGLLVCVFMRGGKTCYRTYDPNRKLSKKEKSARVKFGKLAQSGKLRELREIKRREK